MHRLHRDSHIAARARFRPLNETHYQLRKTNPIFFIRSSSLRKARTRADEIRSPFPLLLFLFLFPFSFLFFSFTPRVSFGKEAECRSREQYASQAPSVAGFGCILPRVRPSPFSIRFSRSTKDKHPTHPQSYLVFATRNGDNASGRNT